MNLSRWFYKATAGVEDFVEGADDEEITSRRNYVYWTIDHSSFQIWVVFVAGVGFFTDAYDLFAVNVVLPILGFVYWDGAIPQSYETALICATLAGTLIGQVLFGVLADIYGRRKMYGLELLVVISATLGVAMSATGERKSMDIVGWLLFWRFTMGIGIGGDYPLSAVICSEFAPRRHRTRMLASVFCCQPIGQLSGMIVSLVVITASHNFIPTDNDKCRSDLCIRTLDSAWRWIVGFGSLPAVVALFFRLTIPESPRYLLDVVGAFKSASKNTQEYYHGDVFGQSQELLEDGRNSQVLIPVEHAIPKSTVQGSSSPSLSPSPDMGPARAGSEGLVPTQSSTLNAGGRPHPLPSQTLAPTDDQIDCNRVSTVTMRTASFPLSAHTVEPVPLNEQQPPQASWEDAKNFFIKEKNWIYLVATSSTWFCLDFAFYGLGLSTPEISQNLWHNPNDPTAKAVYNVLLDNTTQSLVLTSIGTMVGSLLIIKAIKYWSSKAIQFYGFIALAILFLTIGGAFGKLLFSDFKGIIIMLYVLCQIAFNLGPNTTTYIIPAEIFPTRYRCTCHGISAAAGKLGSIVGQAFIAHVRFPGEDAGKRRSLGWILMVLAFVMAIGAPVSRYFLPETQDEKGESKSLEALAQGKKAV